ncbi:MAG TPA: helix-turn-helix domain-containing protein [Candidatus Thermoplasmatota archaeon]
MRRARLSVSTASWTRNFGYPELFGVVVSARVVQNLTLTQQTFVDLWEVRFLPGKAAPDLVGAFGIEAASRVAPRGRHDLVLVRAPFHGFLKRLYFGFGVSFQPPIDFRRDAIEFTVVGSDAAFASALAYLRRSRLAVETLEAGRWSGRGADPLEALTPRQRTVLRAAYGRGYFDVPAKADARSLAREMGVSHQAVVDILHRAERRLVAQALEAAPPEEEQI